MNVFDLDQRLAYAIEQATIASVRTEMNGHYRFADVKPGRYVIFAFYKTTVDDDAWFVGVDVPTTSKQDLSNYNFDDPRFSHRWASR